VNSFGRKLYWTEERREFRQHLETKSRNEERSGGRRPPPPGLAGHRLARAIEGALGAGQAGVDGCVQGGVVALGYEKLLLEPRKGFGGRYYL
jgi:hypothetical protein